MSDEATIHVVTESEPDASSVHDAVTAAVTEAEHREAVEESLEEIAEEQDAWAQTQASLMSGQSAILETVARLEATLLRWTTAQEEATVVVATGSPTPSETQPDDSLKEATPGTAPTDAAVEERILSVQPEESSQSDRADDRQSSPDRKAGQSFYSPLRNLLRARKRHAE